jgi:antagonist of KipI
MDPYSHRLANALVGNAASDATLEVTLVGPELVCDEARVVAIAGAELDVTIGDRPVPMNVRLELDPGVRLAFGQRRSGARAYVAIEGGINVAPVLGSRATHVTSGMGGLEGRALRRGDRLPLGERRMARPTASAEAPTVGRSSGFSLADLRAASRTGPAESPRATADSTDDPPRARVLLGPHLESFAAEAVDVLQAAPYVVGPQSDRMGFRLKGAPLTQDRRTPMISDATPIGALQVPASGLPVLLMADRQTTGGYPIVATVISADLGIVGQLAPGDSISFVVCTRAEAIAALVAREQRLMSFERAAHA